MNDFAIAAPDAGTSNILMDLIKDRLKIPINHQSYLNMYNGVDIFQTRYYIKMSVQIYIKKYVNLIFLRG